MEAKANGWVAVGFSETPNMVCLVTVFTTVAHYSHLHVMFSSKLTSDVVGCNVYSDDSVAAIDTWCPSLRKTNVLDKDQVGFSLPRAQ